MHFPLHRKLASSGFWQLAATYWSSEKHDPWLCGETMSEEIAGQLYNKPEHRHTLVGNWQEEQKLFETTGNHRYKVLGESGPTQKRLLHA